MSPLIAKHALDTSQIRSALLTRFFAKENSHQILSPSLRLPQRNKLISRLTGRIRVSIVDGDARNFVFLQMHPIEQVDGIRIGAGRIITHFRRVIQTVSTADQ